MDENDEYANEYELRDLQQRVISLNERMMQREVDMNDFRNALAVKEAELQNALSDASRHSAQYNKAKIDLVNLERQISETEKRVHLKEQENDNLKQRLFSIESTKEQLSKTYYQALSDLKTQLENSQQIIYHLEQRSGRDGNNKMVEIVRSVRQASSLELKRMVNEAKEKFDLMLREVKLQRDEIKKNATTLSEENSILRSQVDHLLGELSSTHEKLMMSDNQQAILLQNFESERRTMQIHIKNVEETLQKTQDLLLMKMQDLEITKEKSSSPQTDLLNYFPSKIQPPRFEDIIYSSDDVINTESVKETSKPNESTTAIKTRKILPNRPFSAPVTSTLNRRLNAPARLSARNPSKNSSIKVHNAEQYMQSFGPAPLNKKQLEIETEESKSVEKLERPASASMKKFLGPNEGTNVDYFDAMFNDTEGHMLHSSGVESFRSPFNLAAKFDAISKENEHSNSLGSLKVVQIDRRGDFIEIANTSTSQEISVGGFMVQQNIGGHPAAVFRFPPRTRIAARSTCMVWSDKATEGIHNPPCDYLAVNINKWSSGPESTTILCKPNGQAVSWLTNKQNHKTHRNSLLGTYADVQKGVSRQKYDSEFQKTVPEYDGKSPVLFKYSPNTQKQTPTINRTKQSLSVS